MDAKAALRASLSAQEQLEFGEGERHLDAKMESRETLRAFFGGIGRSIYVAAELTVLYPGEESITPDLIAVRDVGLHKRNSWMVTREGKGIDLALEVLNRGNRRKDLEQNLIDYSRLGIREYFVLDIERNRLHAYQLSNPQAAPKARRYVPVLGNLGRYRSEVLELDLSVVDGQLRFYMGTAELSTKDEELARLGRLVQQEQTRLAEEQARAEQEQARAEQEQARAEQEQARADLACVSLAEGVVSFLHLRGLPLPPEMAARIRESRDVGLLSRWMGRAATISAEELGQGRLFQDS